MAKALIISTAVLMEDSIFNDNIDPKYLRGLIDECQDEYILPILGSAQYNAILDKIDEEESFTAYEEVLVDSYIVPCLKAYIKCEAPYELTFKYTNKGVVTKTSENSQTIDNTSIKMIMDHYKDKAESKANRLKLYLEANPSKFPLYLNYGNNIDDVKPVRSTFTTGMYLGDNDCYDKDYCKNRPEA